MRRDRASFEFAGTALAGEFAGTAPSDCSTRASGNGACAASPGEEFFRQGRGRRAHVLDVERHVVDRENEDIFDFRPTAGGGQPHCPLQIETGGVQLLQRRHRARVHRDLARPHLAEIVEIGERVAAIGHGVARQRESDAPLPGDAGLAVVGGVGADRSLDRIGERLRASARDGQAKPLQQQSLPGGIIAVGVVDERPHMVARREHGGHQFGGRRRLSLADPIKGRFAMVGEGGQRLVAEHAARPLQRVQAAKHHVDAGAVIEAMFEVEQSLFDLFEKLGGFGEEDFQRVDAHLANTLLTSFRS